MKLKGKLNLNQRSCVYFCALEFALTSALHFFSHWSRQTPEGSALESNWNATFAAYQKKYPEEAAELKPIITGELPAGWEKALPVNGELSFVNQLLYSRYRHTHQSLQEMPPETCHSNVLTPLLKLFPASLVEVLISHLPT